MISNNPFRRYRVSVYHVDSSWAETLGYTDVLDEALTLAEKVDSNHRGSPDRVRVDDTQTHTRCYP